MDGASVVVAGISGRLPESCNLNEFWTNLLGGKDMVTEDERRWKPSLYGLPKSSGKLPELCKFDAEFFNINALQADAMDPQLRLLLEVTYEAIVDAGFNPGELRGSNTGVFSGHMLAESLEASGRADNRERLGYGVSGGCEAMFGNYISYCFDLHGPSFSLNTACSSSFYSLDLAVQSIISGQCRFAIATGVNVTLKPGNSMHLNHLGMLSPTGRCRSFDAAADGYVRAEGVVAVLLTKMDTARRAYLKILGCRSQCDGYKKEGVVYPSGLAQERLLRLVYADAGVDPGDVFYVEAHGTGTIAGDYEECKALDTVICARKQELSSSSSTSSLPSPVLLGSVKSNIGHTEAASGASGLAKVVLSLLHGQLPPNLHLNSPGLTLTPIISGQMKVVTDATVIPHDAIVSLNSFGFGGAISHVIVQGLGCKEFMKIGESPLVVPCTSRTEEGLQKLMDFIEEHRTNQDLLSLLQHAMENSPDAHPYRGYLLSSKEEILKEGDLCEEADRPVWLVFGGMGAQWGGMGKHLLQYPIFRETIEECFSAIPLDASMILSPEDISFSELAEESSTIAAVSIGLLRMIRAAGIKPDGYLGHSLGELLACHCDGVLTAKQTVQIAYWRAKMVSENVTAEGGMAAVGMTWEEVAARCPDGVLPCCNNALDNITISGWKEPLQKFLSKLKEEGIFAKEVSCSNIPFHTPMMKSCITEALRSKISEIIPTPKPFSSKMLLTSIHPSEQQPGIQCSASFHLNNLTSSVHFYDALLKIPQNALLIEVSPHALLQAILKRVVPPTTKLISLQNRREKDQAVVFMRALGCCHVAGAMVDPLPLLGLGCQYLVSPQTPHIAHVVSWDHSTDWFVPGPEDFAHGGGGLHSKMIALSSHKLDLDLDECSYLKGHSIDGCLVYPPAGYVVLVWKTLADSLEQEHMSLAVKFTSIRFHHLLYLDGQGDATSHELSVMVSLISGHFEISNGSHLLVSGNICEMDKQEEEEMLPSLQMKEILPSPDTTMGLQLMSLTSSDVYKEFSVRGYQYSGHFKTLHLVDASLDKAAISCSDGVQWVTLLDAMMQFSYLQPKHDDGLYLPSSISHLLISPTVTAGALGKREGKTLSMCRESQNGTITAPGVLLEGLDCSPVQRRAPASKPRLEAYTFVPYFQPAPPTMASSLVTVTKMLLDVALENMTCKKVAMLAFQPEASMFLAACQEVVEKHTILDIHLDYLSSSSSSSSSSPSHVKTYSLKGDAKMPLIPCSYDIIILPRGFPMAVLPELLAVTSPHAFVLLEEAYTNEEKQKEQENLPPQFTLTASRLHLTPHSKTKLSLYHKSLKKERESSMVAHILVTPDMNWVVELKEKLGDSKYLSVYCIADASCSGVIGLVNSLKWELYGDRLRCVLLREQEWDSFRFSALWEGIREADLIMNIVSADGMVGSYRLLPLEKEPEVEMEKEDRFTCSSEKAYIITGGLGGLGLELASWLVDRGALHLSLTSRSGVKTAYQQRKLRLLERKGAEVTVFSLDVTEKDDVHKLLQETMGKEKRKIGGIFHLAAVNNDGLFDSQSPESFMSVLKPKLMGGENLDAALQEADCGEALFVVYSSVCAGMGCAGTSSYSYANSAAERVCERRMECGLHALAVQWGPISDAGMIAGRSDVDIPGTQPQTVHSCLSMMDSILRSSFPVISCYAPRDKTREAVEEEMEASKGKTFKAAVAQILGLKNPQKLKEKMSLSRLGLDSMISFELRHLLDEYDLSVSATELPSMTVLELMEKIEATGAVRKHITPQSSSTILATGGQGAHEE